MKVKEFIKQLELCDPDSPIQFYFLDNYNLNNCKLETVIEADGQTEITIEENKDELKIIIRHIQSMINKHYMGEEIHNEKE